LTQAKKIAHPRAKKKKSPINGIAQSIVHENGRPSSAWKTIRTRSVGRNLKSDTTAALIGNINRGNAELRTNLPPDVIDFAPATIASVTR